MFWALHSSQAISPAAHAASCTRTTLTRAGKRPHSAGSTVTVTVTVCPCYTRGRSRPKGAGGSSGPLWQLGQLAPVHACMTSAGGAAAQSAAEDEHGRGSYLHRAVPGLLAAHMNQHSSSPGLGAQTQGGEAGQHIKATRMVLPELFNQPHLGSNESLTRTYSAHTCRANYVNLQGGTHTAGLPSHQNTLVRRLYVHANTLPHFVWCLPGYTGGRSGRAPTRGCLLTSRVLRKAKSLLVWVVCQ